MVYRKQIHLQRDIKLHIVNISKHVPSVFRSPCILELTFVHPLNSDSNYERENEMIIMAKPQINN